MSTEAGTWRVEWLETDERTSTNATFIEPNFPLWVALMAEREAAKE